MKKPLILRTTSHVSWMDWPAYESILSSQELRAMQTPQHSVQARAKVALPLPPPPRSKMTEERKSADVVRTIPEDKWTTLSNYRKSKGIYFACEEKWS